MPRDEGRDDELLAAYVDGISELTSDERRRAERHIEQAPGGRDAEDATRALLGQLRELTPAHGEPDWTALERSIGEAVGPEVPRQRWRGWRLVVAGLAVAATAALLVVLQQPAAPEQPLAHDIELEQAQERPPMANADPILLWLDGVEVEVGVDLDADALLDDPMLALDDPEGELFGEVLLAPSELAWTIDELDDESLQQAEEWLDHTESPAGAQPGLHRKQG